MKLISTKTRQTTIELVAAIAAAVALTLLIRYSLVYYTGLQTPLVVVKGHSMYPFFLDGDMVLIKKATVNNTIKGSIIVYRTITGKLIIHRVVERIKINNMPALIVKGDNNPFPDVEPVSDNRLVGEVVGITLNDNNTQVLIVPKIPLVGKIIPLLGG